MQGGGGGCKDSYGWLRWVRWVGDDQGIGSWDDSRTGGGRRAFERAEEEEKTDATQIRDVFIKQE